MADANVNSTPGWQIGQQPVIVSDGSPMDTTTLIFAIVLGTILCDYALSLLSSLLNYRALDQPLPAEFGGVYQPAAYTQSQRYTKAKSVHALLHGTFDLGVLLLFWLAFDGFERLDLAVRAAVPGEAAHLEVGRSLPHHLPRATYRARAPGGPDSHPYLARWAAACCTWQP